MRILLTLVISLTILFSHGQTIISGIAKNYVDTVFYIRETGGFDNFTRAWRDKAIKVVINKNGLFKSTIPEQAINTWYIKTEKGSQYFDLISAKNLTLIADFSLPSPLVAIKKNANEFNFSSSAYATDSVRRYQQDNQFHKKIRSKNIDSVLLSRKALANYKIHLLSEYRKSHKLSDIYYNWLHSKYAYEPYKRTIVENIENTDPVDDITLAKIVEKGVHDEYAALNNSTYNDIVEFYIQTKFFKQKKVFSANGYFDFVATGNSINRNTRNVFLTRLMYGMRTAPDSQYIPIFKKYDRIVSNKEMKKKIIEAREDYATPTTPEQIRAPSIQNILNKFKGKVIYVDFWASWCIPCRAEMPNAANLKDQLTGKDIVFVYLAYNDKEKAWTKAKSQLNIEGEHYLLSDSQIKEANELFGINGIPHYVIIDKDGKIINKRADRPGAVYKQLLELSEK